VDRISPGQLLLYAAAGIALLLVGARWMAAAGDSSAQAQGVSVSSSHGSAGPAGGVSFAASGEDVVIDVTGAVRDSGVFRLPAGSRVDDALKRAGGATAAADLEHINLAARLTDGQQVVVPQRAPANAATAAVPAEGADPAGAADAPISLSTATVTDLDTIEGIGPVTAQDIIDFRDQHGGIGSIDDLDEISGIGPATMEALRARLQP
jgi:competence protein ComEA